MGSQPRGVVRPGREQPHGRVLSIRVTDRIGSLVSAAAQATGSTESAMWRDAFCLYLATHQLLTADQRAEVDDWNQLLSTPKSAKKKSPRAGNPEASLKSGERLRTPNSVRPEIYPTSGQDTNVSPARLNALNGQLDLIAGGRNG